MSVSVSSNDDLVEQDLQHPPASLAWLMWTLGGLLFLIGFFHRIAFGVMGDPLRMEFALTATTLGTLASFYYYSYMPMQVPVGIMADRFGPRKLLTCGAAITALGTVLFVMATNYWMLGLGRLLIGGAVAVAFVTMMKIAQHWFDLKKFSLLTGLGLLAGNLGAVGAGVPLQFLIGEIGWRPVLLGLAALTGVLAVATWIWVRDDPEDLGYKSYDLKGARHEPHGSVLSTMKDAICHRNVLLLTLACGAAAGSALTFGGLWGVPFLRTAYGFSSPEAATITTIMLLVWAGSGVLLGFWSDQSGKRKVPFIVGALVAALGWAVVTQIADLPHWLLYLALVVAAAGSSIMIVGLSLARESVPRRLQGTALGWCNMGVMIGPMILQPLTGFLIDVNWDGKLDNGTRVYDLTTFQVGFIPMIVWLLLAAVLICFAREKKFGS
ncbi:MFS transporter [Kiloniella laminariae]|uniref:MFS transporter n=1 Tax=Kiloniella laminariae TaxID=454162 RepID=UPI00036BE3DF|nr:MFS transporter [Kiloniella laminariae]